jgi:hypothetical protein
MHTAEQARLSVRRRRMAARLTLYFLLLASAAATLFGAPVLEQAVREGRAPRMSLIAAPALLATFIALFALVASIITIGWLFVRGVDEARWKEQAALAAASMWR